MASDPNSESTLKASRWTRAGLLVSLPAISAANSELWGRTMAQVAIARFRTAGTLSERRARISAPNDAEDFPNHSSAVRAASRISASGDVKRSFTREPRPDAADPMLPTEARE